MYDNGTGVKQDYAEAVKWYRKAAEHGNRPAQSNMGLMYENGRGVEKDPVQAVQWYRKSAEQGFAVAQDQLGYMYQSGAGVNQDYALAIQWYRKAAAQGNHSAELHVGFMYESGYGVDKDHNLAAQWYRKSAEAGEAIAQSNLGNMYLDGRGVKQDYAQAAQWYRKAADQGNARPSTLLARSMRRETASKRTSARPSSCFARRPSKGTRTPRSESSRSKKPKRPTREISGQEPLFLSGVKTGAQPVSEREKGNRPIIRRESEADALLVVLFGGPEGPDDVMPFLENVVHGKNVPRWRLLQVAEQYESFGGCSPANDQSRATGGIDRRTERPRAATACLLGQSQLAPAAGRCRRADGRGRRASCPGVCHFRVWLLSDLPAVSRRHRTGPGSGWSRRAEDRQASAVLQSSGLYRGDRRASGRSVWRDSARAARAGRADLHRPQHPGGDGPTVALRVPTPRTCRLVSETVKQKEEGGKGGEDWQLVFQSRSGPPAQPWLEPDIRDHVRRLHAAGPVADLVVMPIGFLTEHKETIYDLDVEVGRLCDELGINLVRAATVGNHPRLVRMIRELVVERLDPSAPRLASGCDGPWPDQCPGDCCLID